MGKAGGQAGTAAILSPSPLRQPGSVTSVPTGPGWFFLSSLTRAACPATQFSLTRALPELATDPTSSGSVPPAPTPDLSHRPDARPLTLLPSLPPSSTPSPTRDSPPCSLVQ